MAASESHRSLAQVVWIAPNFNHYRRRLLHLWSKQRGGGLSVISGQSPRGKGHLEVDDGSTIPEFKISVRKDVFGIHPKVCLQAALHLARIKPDVVVMNTEKRLAPVIMMLWLIGKVLRFKLTTYSHPFMRSRMDRITSADLFWTKFLFLFYDAVVFYTEESRQRAVKAGVITDSRSERASNTLVLPDDIFCSDESGCAQTLLFLGRLIPEKGVNQLFWAFDRWKQKLPNLRLNIIGEGPLQSHVTQACASRDGAEYLGATVDDDEITEAMQSVGAVILPDYAGLAIVHAFAYGKPFITTFTEAHGPEIDYLQHNYNGLLLGPDADKNADQVVRLLTDTAFYQELSEAARNTYLRIHPKYWCDSMDAIVVKLSGRRP